MKKWTTQAEQRLGHYLEERAAREGFADEEAVDLKDDLRRHIHEEAERSEAETIGLMHLENLLGKLEIGYLPPVQERLAQKLKGKDPQSKTPRGGFFHWTFGVVWPLIVLLIEVLSSFCGSTLFKPVPTWWHAAWIASVPLLNAWLMMRPRNDDRSRGVAAGFALMTAGFYGLLFLPLIHWSVIGLIFLGLGLLPLSPILATIFSWRIGRAAKLQSSDPGRFKTGWRIGAAATVLVLLALEGPALWTRANLAPAVAGTEESEAAVNRLRKFHSERTLLMACYEGNRGMGGGTDISGWIINFYENPERMMGGDNFEARDSEKVRDLFFRVTGKPFNSLKPPGKRGGDALVRSGRGMNEFEFDDHLGGDDVAVRLKNLDLAESRFDGHVDTVSRLGYGEWTMVFKNGSANAQEARCQVRLPRDGRVSRLTLWVNGEPREAAFSTVSKVKAAYKAVAVVQRRDPVLVTMVGPDTVMVQCFPVPAHGEMKIRFGITAPLDGTRWEMPYVAERNFGLKEGIEHAVWLQGDGNFSLTGGEKGLASVGDGDGNSLAASLADNRLMTAGTALVTSTLPPEPAVVWCEDRFAKPEERILVREPVTITRAAADQVVVVIDGSASLARTKEWLVKALRGMDARKLHLVLADDHSHRITSGELESYDFTGGRDNEPALREGIRLAKESGCPVVWIHGPQVVKLSQPEALLQLLERGTIRPVIHEVEAVPGPNRLAEALYRSGCLHRGPSLSSPENDFSRFLADLATERQGRSWNWKRSADAGGLPGSRVWDQLARHWAASSVENPSVEMTDAARGELAATYQLVTPFSGAVVLETKQQYDEHGLTPADGSATPKIPSVPEPSTGLLVLLTATAALMRRKRAA